MIFYPRYPAHYLGKTLHLTMEEDGAYTRLLDWMYMNNAKSIPKQSVLQIARASKPREKRAVTSVLAQFFFETETGYENERVSSEVDKNANRAETARNNGLRGGRPRKQKPSGFSAGSEKPPPDNPEGKPDAKQTESSRKTTQTQTQKGVGESTVSVEMCETSARAVEASASLRKLGMRDVMPTRPELLALLEAGATLAQLTDTARELTEKRGEAPKLGYLAATLQGRARDVAAAGAAGVALTVVPGSGPRGAESSCDRVERLAQALDRREGGSDG